MNTPQDSDFRDGMPFLGSRLWIDFVNSAPVALGDFLATAEGWQRWRAAARLDTDKAGAGDLAATHALRGSLSRLFENLMSGTAPQPGDLARLNGLLAAQATHPHLEWRDGTLKVEERSSGGGGPLAAIAADFVDFAAHHEPARLRHCANPECSLVFYDTARNGTRRWCSMAACGNRHKVRSHRMRVAAVSSS
ncbi:CGNR zinc finger domain-containing protein [Xanthobacter autotrophicus DSM 431]|uniref:CGNR zinc finger domain-containing protein n=1 Tax=Xanthobacter nonsaccharivorans TaxID=3119912 RepID=UPI00372BF9D0